MSDQPAADPNAAETTRVEDIKSQAKALMENVKAEVAQRLDQFLDELGALI